MKTSQLTPDSGDSIDRFLKLIHTSYDGLIEAAKLAREQLLADPEWGEKVQERSKIVTAQAVHRFACIGVKFIPQLAISECPGAKRLRNFELEFQEKYTKEPLPLLVKTYEGWDTLLVDLYNLTTDQAAQVFSVDHVRSEAAQRAWIEDRNAKRVVQPSKSNSPFRVVHNELVVMVPCRISRKELAQIFADLES